MATIGKVNRQSGFRYERVADAAEAIASYDANVGFQYEISLLFDGERNQIGYEVRVKDADGYGVGYLHQEEI